MGCVGREVCHVTPTLLMRMGTFDWLFMIAHDDHVARFRPITIAEQMAIVHFQNQMLIAEKLRLMGSGEEVPEHLRSLSESFDGRAMMPRGAAFAPNDVWVCAVDESMNPTHCGCVSCIRLAGEAVERWQNELRGGVSSTDPQVLIDVLRGLDIPNQQAIAKVLMGLAKSVDGNT